MAPIIVKNGQISSSAGISVPGSLSISGNVIVGDSLSGTAASFSTINVTTLSASSFVGLPPSAGGLTPPGGSDTTIQFNSGSTFSGSANLTYNYTTNILSGSTARFTTITGSTLVSNTYQASIGSVSAVSYGFGSSGIDTGIYRAAINQLGIATNGAEAVRFVNQANGAQIQMSSLGGIAAAPTLTWNGDNNCGIFRDTADQIGFSTNAVERMRITNSGVGIGISSPAQTLDISGTLRIRTLVAGTNTAIGRSSTGDITAATSDQRLKKNITTLTGALNSVSQLRGVNFKWDNTTDQEFIISEEEQNKNQIGLIAQEVEQIYPELVYLNGIKDYKSVRYAEIVSILIEAVKELKQENENLKTRISALENK